MSDNKEKQLNIIKRKDWLILVAVLLLFTALAVWSFFGIVQTTIESTGVSFHMPDDDNTYVAVPVDRNSINMIEVESTVAHIFPDWENEDGKTYISGTACYVSPMPLNAQELEAIITSGDMWDEEATMDSADTSQTAARKALLEEMYKILLEEYDRSYIVFFRLDREDEKYVLNSGEVIEEFPEASFCDVIVILKEASPYEIYFSGNQ